MQGKGRRGASRFGATEGVGLGWGNSNAWGSSCGVRVDIEVQDEIEIKIEDVREKTIV